MYLEERSGLFEHCKRLGKRPIRFPHRRQDSIHLECNESVVGAAHFKLRRSARKTQRLFVMSRSSCAHSPEFPFIGYVKSTPSPYIDRRCLYLSLMTSMWLLRTTNSLLEGFLVVSFGRSFRLDLDGPAVLIGSPTQPHSPEAAGILCHRYRASAHVDRPTD